MEKKLNNRVISIDVLRGLIMVLMTIVNYCGGLKNIPMTLKHAKIDVDTFTLADTVVPGFLFVVGLSIPYAFLKRIENKESFWRMFCHISIRTLSLLFLGVWWVNSSGYSSELTKMSVQMWYILGYIGVFLLWIDYSKMENLFMKKSNKFLKIAGALLVIYLIIIYRAVGSDNQVHWLQTSWWGILGTIGWAYFFSAIVYLLCRGKHDKLLVALGVTVAIYMGLKNGAFPIIHDFSFMKIYINWGSKSTIVLAGAIVSSVMYKYGKSKLDKESVSFLIFFSLMLIFAGILLRPIHHFSKLAGTESYSLVTAGLWSVIYLILFYVIDYSKKCTTIVKPLVLIGKNPLLLYFLPNLLKNILEYTNTKDFLFPFVKTGGLLGFLNILIISIILFAITIIATKKRLIMKL